MILRPMMKEILRHRIAFNADFSSSIGSRFHFE